MSAVATSIIVRPGVLAAEAVGLALGAGTIERVAVAYRGPQRTPPLGDPRCDGAYALAHHQLARLVSEVAIRSRELAAGTRTASALYAVLDPEALR